MTAVAVTALLGACCGPSAEDHAPPAAQVHEQPARIEESWLQSGGLRTVALDLPGFGSSLPTDLATEDVMYHVIEALGDEPVVLVSPSMSGAFSLPFVLDRSDAVLGYVPIAPAGIAPYQDRLPEVHVPTLILWGSADAVVPLARGEALARAIPGSRLSIFEGASHPCYLDQASRFHAELIDFVRALAPRK